MKRLLKETILVGIAMLKDIQLEMKEDKIDTKHLHYDDLENAENYNTAIDNCIDTIQGRIDRLKENKDSLKDNIKTFSEGTPLSKKEWDTMLDIAETMKVGVPCTACRYC